MSRSLYPAICHDLSIQQYVMDLFDNFIDPGLKFIKKKATQGMDTVSQFIGQYPDILSH